MSFPWNNTSGLIQGDISYLLRLSSLEADYADFTLVAYSEKWPSFNISFEYKMFNEDIWRDDASIIASNATNIDGNMLSGMDASKYGSINIIRWGFKNNHVVIGSNIQIRIKVLPSVRSYSTSTIANIVSEINRANYSNMIGMSTSVKVLAHNKNGQMICLIGTDTLAIRDTISGVNLLAQNGFNYPSHVVQLANGCYLVADTYNNNIVELDASFLFTGRNLPINRPIFIDYTEEYYMILVTRKEDNLIEEYTWSDSGPSYGALVWTSATSSMIINSPECATYHDTNKMKIAIANSGSHSVILYNRTIDDDNTLNGFRWYDVSSSSVDILYFNNPFRVFWWDQIVYVVEKDGKVLSYGEITHLSSGSSTSDPSSL